MKCPHCGTAIHFEEEDSSDFYKYSDEDKSRNPGSNGYVVAYGFCPACEELIVMLRSVFSQEGEFGDHSVEEKQIDILYPKFSSRPVESEVPQNYRQDFGEANGVLGISPKASAAISRRLLQHILLDELSALNHRACPQRSMNLCHEATFQAI